MNGCQHRRKSGGKGIRQEFAFARHGVLEGARRASANTPMARGASDLGVVNDVLVQLTGIQSSSQAGQERVETDLAVKAQSRHDTGQ